MPKMRSGPRVSKKLLKPANLLLERHLKELGLDFEREYKFHQTRKWRFDYLLNDSLAIEIEGGVYTRGRHTRGKTFEADCLKYNTGTLMGYRILRFSTGQILKGEAKALLEEYLG